MSKGNCKVCSGEPNEGRPMVETEAGPICFQCIEGMTY